ncbi:MAG: hypothetical protein CMH55_06815 [Myxococcales bacterium]|nr:hypothetical protein [Myxococcales bacterium]
MTAVYVHYPYCETLCPYCDFFSSTRSEDQGFFPALIRDLERWNHWLDEGPVRSLYFGGGTPSRMSVAGLRQVMTTVARLWGWPASPASPAEVTLEANPGDVTPALLAAWREAGVTRISLGSQSFRDEELQFLGRRHDAAQALDAARMIADAGFASYSLDLIFGLPGQSDRDLDESLDMLAALRPPHVSLYGLTIEEGTAFGTALAQGLFDEMKRDQWLGMYQRVCQWAQSLHYHHYEVSNFAQPGHESRHNRQYWRNRSWVGVGPAAHGQRLTAEGLERRGNPRSVRAWRQNLEATDRPFLAGAGLRESLSADAWLREACMIGLRDLELGIAPERWCGEFGIDDPALFAAIQAAKASGWIERSGACRLTSKGLLVADQVAERLLNATLGSDQLQGASVLGQVPRADV